MTRTTQTDYTGCPATDSYRPIGRHVHDDGTAVATVIAVDQFGPVLHIHNPANALKVGDQLQVKPSAAAKG